MRRFRSFADHRPGPAPLAGSRLCRAFQALAEPIGRLLDLGAASWAADRFSRLGALDPDYPRYEAARGFHPPAERYPASFRMSCGHWHRRYSRLVRPPTRRSRRPQHSAPRSLGRWPWTTCRTVFHYSWDRPGGVGPVPENVRFVQKNTRTPPASRDLPKWM